MPKRASRLLAVVGCGFLLQTSAVFAQQLPPSVAAYIDNHTHPDPEDLAGSAEAAIHAMPKENMAQVVFLPAPFKTDAAGKYDAEQLVPLAKKYPGKILFYGGGGSLNGMLQDAVTSGHYDLPAFRKRAEELVRMGVAGFGELSLEHFSQPNVSDYQYAPADHPLMLALADIAAKAGIPITVHMEAVPAPMPIPAGYTVPPHPENLRENIAAMERLLKHNPRAKIIWTHAGSDFTGKRTPELCRQLLSRHPNLYMELKIDPAHLGLNVPMPESGSGPVRSEWAALFHDFPKQFLIGSDQHYGPKDELLSGKPRWAADVALLNALPADVRPRVAFDNASALRPKNAPVPSN